MNNEVSTQAVVAANANVMVATPAYGGMMHSDFVQSLLRFRNAGLNFALMTLGNESLITRARNSLISLFYYRQEFTHLLFLDADVGIPPEGFAAMLKANKDVIGIPVALKGRTPAGDRIYNLGALQGETGPYWLVDHIGTAVLMLSRRAVTALVEDAKADGRAYQRPPYLGNDPSPPVHFDIFRVGTENGVYLSEDFWVCHQLRELGFDIHVIPEIATRHHGVVSV